MKDKAEAARSKNVLTERTVPGAHTAEAARESREVFPRFKGQVKYLKLGPQREGLQAGVGGARSDIR